MKTLMTAKMITMSEATKPKFTADIPPDYDKMLKILSHARAAARPDTHNANVLSIVAMDWMEICSPSGYSLQVIA